MVLGPVDPAEHRHQILLFFSTSII